MQIKHHAPLSGPKLAASFGENTSRVNMIQNTGEILVRPASKQPWDFSLTPNYEQASAIDVLFADHIDETHFYKNYVNKNRPCLIKGAAKHWPGFKNWKSTAYLKQLAGKDTVRARSTPDSEFKRGQDRRQMSFEEFVDHASTRPEQLVVHSIPLRDGLPLSALLSDIGNYTFLPKPSKPRAYLSVRAFFYRNSYTDWHSHPSDETLMTQVVGAKEVLLLPPNDQVWNAFEPVARDVGYLYGIDLERFPDVRDLRPSRAVVEAGDALYIPVYWWHAVASADDDFGVTVAKTFGTPLHVAGDLRFPLARRVIKNLLFTRMFPIAVAAVVAYYVSRALSFAKSVTAQNYSG